MAILYMHKRNYAQNRKWRGCHYEGGESITGNRIVMQQLQF